jgi:hypothetical protein
MFGEKEKVRRVINTSGRYWGAIRGIFAQYRVAVKAETYHGRGSRAHGGWYR